jgi:sulfoxide reductase heme-binding subunit YedZ
MVLLERQRAHWFRILVHIAALAPLAWMLWQYGQGLFIVDPVREMTTRTGKTALILLMLSLACSPINTVFGWKKVLGVRRALGVYAFFCGVGLSTRSKADPTGHL